jgi:hypothetical protein
LNAGIDMRRDTHDAKSTRHGWQPRGNAGLRYRVGVAVRAVAAIGGGYAVAALCSAAVALYLPATRAEAALTGTMVAFVVYPCAVLWVFAARSATRAWLGLLWAAAALGALLLWHYYGGGKP